MGKNLIIIKSNGNRVPIQNRRTVTRITSAKQTWALNADDKLTITVESTCAQIYNIGDKINVFGRDYTLNRLPKVRRIGAHEFSYELEFEGVQYDLLRATYDLNIDTTNNTLQDVQGDSLTGDLHRFMTVLVANANRVFPGKWALGLCPETVADKTLTFGEADNCLLVLQNLCGASNFNVEYEIEKVDNVYTINLKTKVGQILPYTFMFGKGRGLYELSRENVSSANIVTRLKVYGSTENITNKYRADRLCLPGKTKGQSYIEKAEAVAKYGIFEGRKDFDDIKPTFTGTVMATVQGNVLQFVDTSFPFDLNEKEPDGVTTKYLIDGLDAKIHFNTGNLAGYDFTIKNYDHATHTFTINKLTDERGDVFPSAESLAFQFVVGDKYKITDIAYPPEIEEQAEQRLAEQGDIYYQQNSQPKVQYGLAITKQWLESIVGAQNGVIVNVFTPGDYLHIVDNEIDVDKSVRIKSFTRNILDPYDYALTISDLTVTTSITNLVLSELIDIDKVLTINNLKDPTRARANWRASREVLDMVFDPDGDYYTDKIKPNSIDTLALSVGAKAMQFSLTNTVFQPNYKGDKNSIRWQGGVLTHYTIHDENVAYWILADGHATLVEDSSAFYIYAKCDKATQAGTIVLDTRQFDVDNDVNYYYFLIGVLNSVDSTLKVRSIALMYGFTMVNGRFIKTGRIESADGLTYFDLDNSEIGGRIVFTSGTSQKTLNQLNEEVIEAQNVAEEKPRIFTSQPQAADAYKVGDLWVNATYNSDDITYNNELLRCITAKEKNIEFSIAHWALATSYDNTQTTIDGGIVTSGTLQVASDSSSILAGMTGNGVEQTSIRFWAGTSFDNRAFAPFRVQQDGSVVMTKALIEGDVVFAGFIKPAKTIIDATNFIKYSKIIGGYYQLDASKLLGNVILDKTLNTLVRDEVLDLYILMISQWHTGEPINVPQGNVIEDYIGYSMRIINNTSYDMAVTGLLMENIEYPPVSISVASGNEVYLECVVRWYNGNKQIGWLIKYNNVQ